MKGENELQYRCDYLRQWLDKFWRYKEEPLLYCYYNRLLDFHVCIKHLSQSDVAGGGAIPVYVCEICIIKAGLSSS